MKQSRQHREPQEPMGIVIVGAPRDEVVPRVAAYVWGPAPEPAVEPAEVRAA